MANFSLGYHTIPNQFDPYGDDFYKTQILNEKTSSFWFSMLFLSFINSFGHTKIWSLLCYFDYPSVIILLFAYVIISIE